MVAIFYGRFADDKEEGIYLDGIYFGGVSAKEDSEDVIRRCVNSLRGGTIQARAFPIPEGSNVVDCLPAVRRRFAETERQMIEVEDTLSRKRK